MGIRAGIRECGEGIKQGGEGIREGREGLINGGDCGRHNRWWENSKAQERVGQV